MSEFPLLTIRDVSVTYRDGSRYLEALAGVDLDLAAGLRLAVIGESGSGKSSFGLALAGLLPPNAIMAGRVTWPSLRRDPVLGRDIGFVFQDASGSLDPMMRVGDQIAEVCGTHLSLSRAQARAQAIELLARVKLPDPSRAARAFPHQLSGGQRQRVAIAAAIAARPRLLIADEPTSALDSVVQAEIVALIQELVHQDAMALVFITHDIALAAQIADTIAVFYAARLVEAGAARRVMTRPEHPYTAALLATHLGLDRAAVRPLPTVEGAPPDPAAPPPGCRFAPRCPESEASCSIEPAWRGTLGDGAACIHAGQHARSNAFPYKATAR